MSLTPNEMNLNATVYFLLLLITACFMSCKKDTDPKYVGTYKGTARHTIGDANNPVRDKDTLFTNVSITISKGTESSSKEVRLTLMVTPPTITTSYNENMPIHNGEVDITRTNPGAAGTYYRWKGSIASDSLNLTYRIEAGNGTIYQWSFKAFKQ